MKFRVLSDLHLEFHMDHGESMVAGQKDDAWDVLLLAGDITTARFAEETARWFQKAAAGRPVIWVLGNHEFYGDTVEGTFKEWRRACALHGVTALENETVDVGGHRIHGTTLWFPHSGGFEPTDSMLGDFQYIGGFRDFIKDASQKAGAYLKGSVRPGDVVVTHHLPHRSSVAARYQGDALTRYFLNDVSEFVEGCGAALWVHGHTHDTMRYRAGSTQVVCNPFGYVRYQENRAFQEDLTVDL